MSSLEDRTFRSSLLIFLASILEKCDEQILPALFSRVAITFQATPAQLGNLALARALFQALSSPFAGIANQFYPRGKIIGFGCILWATFTSLFACTSSMHVALPIVAVNGIGLALVIPNCQSLVADYYGSHTRGKAFGTLWLFISVGGMLGALYATNVGGYQPFGIDGWRFVFFSVSFLSIICGLFNAAMVYDPTFEQQQQLKATQQHHQQARQPHLLINQQNQSPAVRALRSAATDIATVMRIRTFALIILQGIVGSVPYASLVFLTLYLQLLGMGNAAASGLVSIYLVGGGLGGLLGGWIGDKAAVYSPNHGRIAATQFSVLMGVPFAVLIFKWLPKDAQPGTVGLYAAVLAAFSLTTAWPAPCCNNPIFAEIVPPRLRNMVYAFDRCFEGAIAAFSVPLVGLLSERWFGFSGASTVTGEQDIDISNATAMGNALLTFLIIPWTFCFIAYSGLHLTYPKDRRAALAAARGERDWEDVGATPTRSSSRSSSPGGGGGQSVSVAPHEHRALLPQMNGDDKA